MVWLSDQRWFRTQESQISRNELECTNVWTAMVCNWSGQGSHKNVHNGLILA